MAGSFSTNFSVGQRKQYTSSYQTPTQPTRPMEHLVRPFQTVESAPPELPTIRRLRPGEDTEASICAGGPARFLRENLNDPITLPGTSWRTEVIWPDNNNDDNGGNPGDVVYQEIARQTETIRVENPNDAEMWVDVKRTERSTFVHQGTGTRLVLIFNNNLEG